MPINVGFDRERLQQKISVLFVFRRNRAEWLRSWQAGKGSSEFLYGMPYLDRSRFDVDFVEGDDASRDWRRRVCFPLEWGISRRVGIGFGLHISWIHWQKIRRADLVISTVDTCGLPLAMLKYLGLLKTPLIYISQGLAHRMEVLTLDKALNRSIRSMYARSLNSVEKILVLGEGAVQPLAEVFGLPSGRVSAVPFGTDDEFWQPAAREDLGGYILSVGSDAARDYPTLLRAVDGRDLRLVTRQRIPSELLSETVRVSSNHTELELRELYRGAYFVVIPLKDVDQPSGQSATLQAMACGKAVILTRTQGLWEPDQMHHLESCYLVRPDDVNGLREAISYLSDHPGEAMRIGQNARRLVEERYSSRRFATDLERHISGVLALNSPDVGARWTAEPS